MDIHHSACILVHSKTPYLKDIIKSLNSCDPVTYLVLVFQKCQLQVSLQTEVLSLPPLTAVRLKLYNQVLLHTPQYILKY